MGLRSKPINIKCSENLVRLNKNFSDFRASIYKTILQKFLIISTVIINSPITIKNFTNLSPRSTSSLLIGPSHQQNKNYWYLDFSQKEWMPIGVINSGLCRGKLRGYCSPNRHSLMDLVVYKNNGSQFSGGRGDRFS
jgi:hypothetical protein